IAWLLTLLGMAALSLIYASVSWGASNKEDQRHFLPSAYRIRRMAFLALIGAGAAIAYLTLGRLPYYATVASAAVPTQVVDAVGEQWLWTLTPAKVVAGKPVEFRVTSKDVNHGFAIYDADLRLIAQVQAMPEITNVLRITFAAPGKYQILCL